MQEKIEIVQQAYERLCQNSGLSSQLDLEALVPQLQDLLTRSQLEQLAQEKYEAILEQASDLQSTAVNSPPLSFTESMELV